MTKKGNCNKGKGASSFSCHHQGENEDESNGRGRVRMRAKVRARVHHCCCQEDEGRACHCFCVVIRKRVRVRVMVRASCHRCQEGRVRVRVMSRCQERVRERVMVRTHHHVINLASLSGQGQWRGHVIIIIIKSASSLLEKGSVSYHQQTLLKGYHRSTYGCGLPKPYLHQDHLSPLHAHFCLAHHLIHFPTPSISADPACS